MSDIKLTFVFLRVTLFLVFLVSGYFLSKSKTNKQYWRIAIFPILAFAVVSGLRFGRDIDYNLYYFRYIDGVIGEDYEYLFSVFIDVFNGLGIPYYGFVLFCSTFLILSFLYLLSKFKKAAFYTLPLFLIVGGTENFIRWYLAFSFLLIAVGALIDKRYFITILLAFASYFIHEGMIIVVFIVAMFYFFTNKITLNPKITVMLFLITLASSSIELLQMTMSVFDSLNLNFLSERGSVYMAKMDAISGGELATGVYDKTFISNLRWGICYVFFLYFGGRYFKENKFKFPEVVWLYNLATFSIIIMPLFTLVEILDRISAVFMCLSMIPLGIAIYVAYKERFANKVAYYCLLISFMAILTTVVNDTLKVTGDNNMLFIWDAKGRNFLY